MRSSGGGPRSLARPAMHVIAIFIVSALVLGLPGGAFESAFASNNNCGNGNSQSQNCNTTTATATKTATSTATATNTATATATQCNSNNYSNCPTPTPVCNNGQAVGNPHCNTPTATATATATATQTATATATPCGELYAKTACTPTPTVTATATSTATPKAKIELKKVWVGTAGSTTLKIGTSAGGSQVDSQAVSGANGTTGQNSVNSGTYYLSETTPTVAGGTYTSTLSCRKDINQNGALDADDWTITPGSNGSIEVHAPYLYWCTFTNTFVPSPTPTPTSTATPPAGGSIRIEKLTFDDEGDPISAGSFTFLVDSVAKTPPVAGGSGQTYSGIAAGTHAVTEQAQSGWVNGGGLLLSDIDDELDSCFDLLDGDENDDSRDYVTSAYSNNTGPQLSTSVDVTVKSGKTAVVCWFNQQTKTPPPPTTGSIRVEKIVYAANGSLTSGGSFTFLVDAVAKTPAVTGGSSQTYGAIALGSRVVTEQAQSGWTSLGGATLDNLEAESCRSAFEGAPDTEFLNQSVNATVSADATTVVCWFNRQTSTPPPTPTPTPVCEANCGGGGGETSSESSPPVTPPTAPQVKGSTAQITKVLSSANPARIGERVTFTVTLTVTGDVPVTGVSLVDTYEHAYLRFVGSAPGGCVSSAVDAARSQVMCVLGDMTPGTGGASGTRSAVYMLTFDAVAVTSRTVDTVVAKADLDGSGPAALTTIGPASDGVTIIGFPTALPKAGDGELIESMSFTSDGVRQMTVLPLLFALVAAAAVSLRGSRLWQ